MLDIFLYNENMCFVNISFNLWNNYIDCLNENIILKNNNILLENFYFYSDFLKYNKKYFNFWSTIKDISYFINEKLIEKTDYDDDWIMFLSHLELYYQSYIYVQIWNNYILYHLDFLLNDIFGMVHFSKNYTAFLYDNDRNDLLYDSFFDDYKNLPLFNFSDQLFNYYTIFDFKKQFLGLGKRNLWFDQKVLYLDEFIKIIKNLNFFFINFEFNVFDIIKNLNFKIFGIFYLDIKNFIEYTCFKNYIYLFFLNTNKNAFFVDNFLLFKFSQIFLDQEVLIYFLKNKNYLTYIFSLNNIKVDIFFNNFPLLNNILYNYSNNFRTEQLIDTSVSNVQFYKSKNHFDSILIYNLILDDKNGLHNNIFFNTNKKFIDLIYDFKINNDNYLIGLKKYFYLYDFHKNENIYYYQFYKNILIYQIFFFKINWFNSNIFSFIIGILMYMNLKFLYKIWIEYKLKYFFGIRHILLIFKFFINQFNKCLIIVLILINLKFKLNASLINNELIINKKNSFQILNNLNFDLIIFIYNKFILSYHGYKYHQYFKLLRFNNLINNNINFNLKLKSAEFSFIYFIFLIIFYFYLICFLIYIFVIEKNIFKLVILYKFFYSNFENYLLSFKLKFNIDGSTKLLTRLISFKWYYRFTKYWIIYFNKFNYLKEISNIFIKNEDDKMMILVRLYLKLNNARFLFFWNKSTRFITLLKKYDKMINNRYFFIYKFNEIFSIWKKELNLNYITLNYLYLSNIFSFKVSKYFFDLNLFKFPKNIYMFDFYLFDLLKVKNMNLSSNIYFNLEFENFILKPINKFCNFLFFNNIIFIFLLNTSFLKYFKIEIYLKFIFYYIFNIIYIYIFYVKIYNMLKIVNLNYFYKLYIYIIKFWFSCLSICEIFLNKFLIKLWFYLKKLKYLFLGIFICLYFLNLNIYQIYILFNSLNVMQNYIYIYFFFLEILNFIFEKLFITDMFNYIVKKVNYFVIWNEFNLYFLNYKLFIYTWSKILNEFAINFLHMSTRKGYGINFKALTFNEYKDSFYAWIPHSISHTGVRLIYTFILNKEPELWIYSIQYFSYFYRLGWDFLGFYVAYGHKFNILEHIIYGFFWDSIFHKYYLGYEFNNLLLYYNYSMLINFFKSRIIYFIIYYYLYFYFLIKFIFFKINLVFVFFLSILNFLINQFIMYILTIFNIIFYYLILLYNIWLYIYYLYFYLIISKIYIFLYTFFFCNIFLNFFLFIYNFIIYYNDTLYNFLNMDIDFIKQNIFNYKYKFNEDYHPLGTWPTYVYKFEQYTWVDNIFKEYFIRNLFFYELKNLFFFKTFYTFYMNINRMSFFFLIIYLFIFYRLLQYFLIILNKWFYFTFFNNDWAIATNPELSWEYWNLFSKSKSYHFNEGLNNIIGGNLIFNYYYYNNNGMDKYIFNKKNEYLFEDKVFDLNKSSRKLLKMDYNNNLFFQNQIFLIKNLWKDNFFKNNYVSWYMHSYLFFKNYQFFWYKNLEYIILKYEKIYGSYSRVWIEKHNKDYINTLNVDKYNYLFYPIDGRVTYTHLFTKQWLFYKDFNQNNRFLTKNKNNKPYKLKNLIKNNNLFFFNFKNVNYEELFYYRLQYPFLIFWLTTKDLKLKKNKNLKYLFPFLIAKKEIWNLYNDLFLIEKKKVENLATVPMSAEWLTFFNKSFLLPYLTIFDRLNFNFTYNENNYKGIWNVENNVNRDLFLNYQGWNAKLLKHPSFLESTFYDDFKIIDKFEYRYYGWLVFISKRYFNHLIPVVHTNKWLYRPYMYEQNLFLNYKNSNSNFSIDWIDLKSTGKMDYFKESLTDEYVEPLTPNDWKIIFRRYTQNSFLLGDDGVVLMYLYRKFSLHNVVNKINFIVGFIFFLIPLYIYVVGTEIYFGYTSGFVFKGGLDQPIQTGVVDAMEYYLSLGDYDMQDERYFYVNIIEQEFLDIFTRFYQEIFYNFTNYFNGFNYLHDIKKNNILVNDDTLLNSLYSYRRFHKSGRLYKSYAIKDRKHDSYLEEGLPRFLMYESKLFYNFSDLSHNIPFFSTAINNNLFMIFYNFNFFKKYISEIKTYKIILFEMFQFLKIINNNFEENSSLIIYKNLYNNKQNIYNILYLYLKSANNNNNFFFNIDGYFSKFFYFYLNKHKEYNLGFDTYFSLETKYKEILYDNKVINSKSPNNYLKPKIFYYNLYNGPLDITYFTPKIYKTMTYNKDVLEQIELFKNIGNWNDPSMDFLNKKIKYTSKKEVSIFNALKSTFKAQLILKFNQPFIKVETFADIILKGNNEIIKKNHLYRIVTLDLDWFSLVNHLPLTSNYIKTFDSSYLYLNKYFLSNYIKSFNYLNNNSIIYIDKSTLISENNNNKYWHFSAIVHDSSTITIFPLFEFILYFFIIGFILLSIIYILFIILGNFEFLILKKNNNKLYYDKINCKWIYFTKNN